MVVPHLKVEAKVFLHIAFVLQQLLEGAVHRRGHLKSGIHPL
jgi:hypothetical protein